jgi:hypothetical protein
MRLAIGLHWTGPEVQMRFAVLSRVSLVLLAGILLSGCEVVEGIFKAGMAVGMFVVIAVIALIAFVVSKARRRV